MDAKTYKVVLIGSGGVGKSAFLEQLKNGFFQRKYITTLGVDVCTIKVKGTTFEIWDTAGQEQFSGLGDGYYVNADAAILMFDSTNKLSFKRLEEWKIRFRNVVGDEVPIITVATKCDIVPAFGFNVNIIKISTKNNLGLQKPFIKIMQLLKTTLDQERD